LQRSIVKASYAPNRRRGAWGAHGVYLAREGAQREGERGLGFDAERDDVDLAATLRAWQRAGDERLWKFVVSPEHAASLDLREHARKLVGHMQRDLGTRLDWVAIDHYNTDNPHVHLLVRGRDGGGRELRIPRDYLSFGLRHRSQELATQRLGLRSDREILAARSRAAERVQFTELDRALLRRADPHRIVSYRDPVPPRGPQRERYTHELRRLQFLEDSGLAEKVGTRTWRLLPGMETALRQAQLAGDIVKSLARHLAHVTDLRAPLVVTPLEIGTRITGRLVGRGWTDELQDRRYLMLEGTDGRLHYVPLPPAPERIVTARTPRIGDLVTLTRLVSVHQGREIVQTKVEGIEIAQSIDGLIYRGRLVGYAHGQDKQRFAVIDVGRDEVLAFPARGTDIAAGREVRVTCHRADDGGRLIWRLADAEHERQRQRGRER